MDDTNPNTETPNEAPAETPAAPAPVAPASPLPAADPAPASGNPFDFPQASANFEPALAQVAARIQDKFRVIDAAHAQAAVDAIRRATEEKKAAADVLDTVFGILGKVGGFVL